MSLNDPRDLITEKEMNGAPALVVEMRSLGTAERDRHYKKSLYGRYGVREYWLVNPMAKTIEMDTLDNQQGLQQSACYSVHDELQSPLLPPLPMALHNLSFISG